MIIVSWYLDLRSTKKDWVDGTLSSKNGLNQMQMALENEL
jgi:hypothetical protein